MKAAGGLIFFLIILCVFAGCSRPVSNDSKILVNQPPANINLNINAFKRENENLKNESEKMKKDPDDLRKKAANANTENKNLHEKLHETEQQIDETKKKIK